MKSIFSNLYLVMATLFMMSCQNDEANAMPPADDDISENVNKTLIVYYSYTNHTEEIVFDLKSLVDADVLEVEPTEKGLDYAANNYRIGTEQLTKIKDNPEEESSYPAIDPVDVDMSKYNTVIIATPLWWSQMSSNMQTFLFKYGRMMANKNIGLIVSSHSSGISGVEADAKRLVPNGKFLKSLWINNANHAKRKSLLEQWLKDIEYASLGSNVTSQTMIINVNSHNLIVDLADNSSAASLIDLLKNGPLTYEAHDYGDFEKVGDIGHSLSENNEQITTEPGDVILYQGSNICIYYGTNSWNFTRLGKIRGVTQSVLKEILGDGNVTITLSIGSTSSVNTVRASDGSSSQIYSIRGHKLAFVPESGIYIENGVKKMR